MLRLIIASSCSAIKLCVQLNVTWKKNASHLGICHAAPLLSKVTCNRWDTVTLLKNVFKLVALTLLLPNTSANAGTDLSLCNKHKKDQE